MLSISMAEDDEVDIEGEFELTLGYGSDVGCDVNEPPSTSVNLLPEFSQHPWVLEQGWSLDHCTDEKSKAAIERMLLEEQHHMNGKVGMRPSAQCKPPATKKQWTEEEKGVFLKGLEIFGRSWTRIADLIPTRTTRQVKNYGQQYLKTKAKQQEAAERSRVETIEAAATSMEEVLAAIRTGQPTVPVIPQAKQHPVKSCPTRKISKPSKPATRGKRATDEKAKQRAQGDVLVSDSSSPGTAADNMCPEDTDTGSVDEGSVRTVGHVVVGSARPMGTLDVTESSVGVVGVGDVQAGGMDSMDVHQCGGSAVSDACEDPVMPRQHTRSEDIDEDTDIEITVDDEDVDTGSLIIDTNVDHVYQKLLQDAKVSKRGGRRSKRSKQKETTLEVKKSPARNGLLKIVLEEEIAASKVDVETSVIAENNEQNISEAPVEENDSSNNGTDTLTEPSTSAASRTNVEGTMNSVDVSHSKSVVLMEMSQNVDTDYKAIDGTTIDETGSADNYKELGLPEAERLAGDKQSDCRDCPQPDTETLQPAQSFYSSVAGEDTDDHSQKYWVQTSRGDLMFFDAPEKEAILDRESISDNEKKVHAEFFNGRPNKTAERYLRIRNYIVDSWTKCKPKYLNKTCIRPGLKNCGDVNCIGRIHSYLEMIGAINFGCEQAQYCRPPRRPLPYVREKLCKEELQVYQAARMETMRPRKRRVRDTSGQWVDEKELEGRTIEHKPEEATPTAPKVSRLRNSSFDPFKLVPCEAFSSSKPAPFNVEVECAAMLTMDVHAHMSKTEVIGLLGGRYSKEQGKLHITVAEPCNSLSTGMQCEMDPVSQTQASESIREQGFCVTGWYHSHPTFAPNPSLRDIDTQHKFQSWFAQGGQPFVGMIVSPYNRHNQGLQSQICCLVASKEPTAPTGVPYQFDHMTVSTGWDRDLLLSRLDQLAHKFASNRHHVEMLYYFRASERLTCLDKMLHSIERHLPEEEKGDATFLQTVQNIIKAAFDGGQGTEEDLEEEGEDFKPQVEEMGDKQGQVKGQVQEEQPGQDNLAPQLHDMTDITKHDMTDITKHDMTDVTKHDMTDTRKHNVTDFTKHDMTDTRKHDVTDITKHEMTDTTKHNLTNRTKPSAHNLGADWNNVKVDVQELNDEHGEIQDPEQEEVGQSEDTAAHTQQNDEWTSVQNSSRRCSKSVDS